MARTDGEGKDEAHRAMERERKRGWRQRKRYAESWLANEIKPGIPHPWHRLLARMAGEMR